jgi:parallel beta-helix repeat protein
MSRKEGKTMQRRWSRIIGVGLTLGLLGITQLAVAARTYYVDATIGDDTYSDLQAQNQSTPWRTIKKAVDAGGLATMAQNGNPAEAYTVIVKAGTYEESVESKRDGLVDAPVTIKAASAGTAIIQPPSGTNGFFISHHYHIIDGFVVTDARIGLKMGPHDNGSGPVVGLVVRNIDVSGSNNNGIQFSNAVDGVIEFNKVNQNGLNGISYSGNSSRIHDNVVTGNAQFGIFVRDGVDHQVWNNTVSNNASGNLKIQGALLPPPGGRIFFVDAASGNDSASEVQAQNAAPPWKTIKRGLQAANAGDIVAILPGLYAEAVASLRDGNAAAPITIKAVEPDSVTITPPSGSGVYIGHHHHVVEGLAVTAAATGLQMGPYKTTGAEVLGLVARENHVYANGTGIKFGNVRDGKAMHNVIHNNGKDGITYSGNTATIFNNLVYANGTSLTGEYGITLSSGNGHQVMSNTVYGNSNGGIRLGTATATPVLSTVMNNIVVQNPVGIKEPAGSAYTGRATLDYNDVHGNTSGNYQLSSGSGSVVGSHSISLSPAFVNPANSDFRLSRQGAGQQTDSPVIDRGSDTAEILGLGGRTAFTDKFPDVGKADLGYHGTLLMPTEGTLAITTATLTFAPGNDRFTLSGTLQPGVGSNGMDPDVEYVEVTLGNSRLFLPAGDPDINRSSDGSVQFTVESPLDFGVIELPTLRITFQVGDDFGSDIVLLKGTLEFP